MSTAQIETALSAWPQVEPALHLPRTAQDYEELVDLLDTLVDRVGEDEDHPLASLMEVLGVLIEQYEDENVPRLS
jgi:HTH-type transcriptional regulator/antitoxin HigA